ncbi:CLUMA_CG010516, isoform A, partial [Clunio marinus]
SFNRTLRSLKIVSNPFLIFYIVFIIIILKSIGTFDKKTEKSAYGKIYPAVESYEKKDWHDWKFIEYEASRTGPGENGKAFFLTDPEDIKKNEKIFEVEGLNGLVSDMIPLDRSVPDTRPPICKTIWYLEKLPKVTVIVIFHNEYFSVLIRTVRSIINRTPPELLVELLMVNDASTKEELYEPLATYVRENFDERVKIVNLKERHGLIRTRVAGAKLATGEVLAFFDSHVEANVKPIVLDPKTCTTPTFDYHNSMDFKISPFHNRTRLVFDFTLNLFYLPRLPEHELYPEKPAPLPAMLGAVFVIRKDYFFDIGAYDEGLEIWNGEHFELSIKLWLCGGRLLEVPCSRVAHIFRKHSLYRKKAPTDFVPHNFRRVAEVWFDEYIQYFYRANPEKHTTVDAGDLTIPKKVRKDLKCKPFQYYVEHIVPDMTEKFLNEDRGVFASGAIQSVADSSLCLDYHGRPKGMTPLLKPCDSNLTDPKLNQNFVLNWHRQLKKKSYYYIGDCITAEGMVMTNCNFVPKNQLFYYNYTSNQLINPWRNVCLTANIKSLEIKDVKCDSNDVNQKWSWGFVNKTAIDNWDTYGVQFHKQNVKDFVERYNYIHS